jgi:hypothetical protein
MAKLVVGRGGVDIPDGAYEATLLDLEVCEPTENSKNKKSWLKWTFTVYDGSPEGQEMTAASSTALGPKAKGRPWAESVMNRRLGPGEELDTDTMVPRDCQVVVRNDPDTGFAKIVDVLPPRPRRSGPQGSRPSPSPDGVIV